MVVLRMDVDVDRGVPPERLGYSVLYHIVLNILILLYNLFLINWKDFVQDSEIVSDTSCYDKP